MFNADYPEAVRTYSKASLEWGTGTGAVTSTLFAVCFHYLVVAAAFVVGQHGGSCLTSWIIIICLFLLQLVITRMVTTLSPF